MMLEEKDMTEVLNFAAQILKWNLPMQMTEEKLAKIKIVAGSAITQTHNQLNESVRPLSKIMIKPKISISDLAKLNQQLKTAR